MVKLNRDEQKFLTLLQRIQPATKKEILEHAEAIGMDLTDMECRRIIMRLLDDEIIDAGVHWELRILTPEERANRPYCGGG